MGPDVELREIRVFLALAEELHFGRTAERMGLTQSRVSQSLRTLELKLGTTLVHRTSRRVGLTEDGRRFLRAVGPHCDGLVNEVRRVQRANRRPEGTVRLGVTSLGLAGAPLLSVIEAFEGAHPECDVKIVELPFLDRWGPVLRREVHLMVTRLPVRQPDLTIGPVLAREPRVLIVGRGHPLATAESVSQEDLGDHDVAWADVLPEELADAWSPPTTPSGRPIRRRVVSSLSELLALVARGRLVHPSVPSFAASIGHTGVVSVPIIDMPMSEVALAWRRGERHPAARALDRTAEVMVPAR